MLNTAFGEPTIAVDTHIFRVCNRTGIAPGKTPRKVEDALIRSVPDNFKRGAHHWLILHGRYVCTARRPRCGECAIEDLCEFKDKHPTQSGEGAAEHRRRRNGQGSLDRTADFDVRTDHAHVRITVDPLHPASTAAPRHRMRKVEHGGVSQSVD